MIFTISTTHKNLLLNLTLKKNVSDTNISLKNVKTCTKHTLTYLNQLIIRLCVSDEDIDHVTKLNSVRCFLDAHKELANHNLTPEKIQQWQYSIEKTMKLFITEFTGISLNVRKIFPIYCTC